MGDTARGRAVVQNPPTHSPPANTFQGMVGASTPLLPAKIFSNPAEKAEIYWNPLAPKFYEHLVYGAGKPRCVVPLGAFASACKQDETFANELRQQYTDMARNSTTDGLTNLAFFLLIIDNDLENGGDILKDAAKRHPTAFNLCQYARFAYNCKKEYTAAWQLFEKALVADPTHVDTIGYYAGFVASVQRDYGHAERLFLRCLELAPEHPNHLGGYARFLATVRGRHEDAETYFERSIAADPCNVVNLNNYAAFLAEIRKDYVTAEEFFRKAVNMDPSCGFAVRNLLNFLVLMRGDEAAAKELWQRGGEEALRLSLDETYHPDEICPAVRQDMAAEAKFMQQGRDLLNEKLKLSAVSNEDEMCVSCGQGNLHLSSLGNVDHRNADHHSAQRQKRLSARVRSVPASESDGVRPASCSTIGMIPRAASSRFHDAQHAELSSAWMTSSLLRRASIRVRAWMRKYPTQTAAPLAPPPILVWIWITNVQ